MILDLLGALLGLVYIALVVAATIAMASPAASLRRLTISARLFFAAVGVAVIQVPVHLFDVASDGWFSTALWALDAATAALAAALVVKRRNTKGQRVVAEAERTVRDYLS